VTAATQPAELGRVLNRSLRRWLPRQRWFASRDIVPLSVRVADMITLVAGEPSLVHAIVEVHYTERIERYQLLLGIRTILPDHLSGAWICDVGGRSVYAATRDNALLSRLLPLFDGRRIDSGIRFESTTDTIPTVTVPVRPITAEQSNTSLVFGDRYILKLFRRILPGAHPDVDLHAALHAAGSRHVARVLGTIRATVAGEQATLAILQEFLPGAEDGWALATADAAQPGTNKEFSSLLRKLGRSVAEVHAALADTLGTHAATADDAQAEVRRMHDQLTAALPATPDLLDLELPARRVFERARPAIRRAALQRVHGDLHLGQVLYVDGRWVLIDFEGEPGRPLAERNAPRHPLRDVAGMLRSFDYAAHAAGTGGSADPAITLAWVDRARTAFCDGYSEVLPDPRQAPALLRALELDKAVYEIAYERAHRPDWLAIPLAAASGIVEGTDQP
jgi:maltokinase